MKFSPAKVLSNLAFSNALSNFVVSTLSVVDSGGDDKASNSSVSILD